MEAEIILSIENLKAAQGIYKIECKGNNRIYIGQSVNIKERIRAHRNKLRRGVHNNEILQNSFFKYGISSLKASIVEIVEDRSILTEREFYWAQYFNAFDRKHGFNLKSIVESQWNALGSLTNKKRSRDVTGEKNPGSKLTNDTVKTICLKLNKKFEGENLSLIEIGALFGVSDSAVSKISTGKSWGNVSIDYLNPQICAKWKDEDKEKWGILNEPKYERGPIVEKKKKKYLRKNKTKRKSYYKPRGTTIKGENNPNAKLKTKDVEEICKMLNVHFEGNGHPRYCDISEKFGVNPKTIAQIKAGKCWGAISVQHLNPQIIEGWRDSYKKKWFPQEVSKQSLETSALHMFLKNFTYKKPQIFESGVFILNSSCYL